MKKAICILLVVLMMCPFHILAAEVDWLAPVTPPPEESGEAPPAETQGETFGELSADVQGETRDQLPDMLQPEDPEEPSQASPAELPGDVLETPPADDSETTQPDSESPSEEEDPTVQMRVPSNGQVIINPYGYSVETNLGTTNEQIISTTQYLVSRSNVPISVSVEITGTHSNPDARFVSWEPDPSAKELFLYAEFQPVAEGEDPVWIGSYTGADCQVLINESKGNTVTLPSGDDTPRKVAFRLFGSVSNGPGSDWTGSDSLSVTMSYKFVPQGETETPEEADPEAQPEEETPENPEEEAVLTEEAGQEPEETIEKDNESQVETESPEETTEPIDETDPLDDDPSEIENVIYSDDSHETKHDRPIFREEEDDPPEQSNEDGIHWLKPSETTVESDDNESDTSKKDSEEDSSEPTDNGDSTIAWLEPVAKEEEPGESENDEPSQDEGESKIEEEQEPEPEEQALKSEESDGIAWLTPISPD